MFKFFSKADTGADVVVRWGGLYVLVTGALSWLNRQLPWFSDLGWPELIFLAIWMALVAVFLIAASLALFRLFRPLGLTETQEPAASDQVPFLGPYHGILERIETLETRAPELETRLGGSLDEVRGRIENHIEAQRGVPAELEVLRNSLGALYERVKVCEVAAQIVRNLDDAAKIKPKADTLVEALDRLEPIWAEIDRIQRRDDAPRAGSANYIANEVREFDALVALIGRHVPNLIEEELPDFTRPPGFVNQHRPAPNEVAHILNDEGKVDYRRCYYTMEMIRDLFGKKLRDYNQEMSRLAGPYVSLMEGPAIPASQKDSIKKGWRIF